MENISLILWVDKTRFSGWCLLYISRHSVLRFIYRIQSTIKQLPGYTFPIFSTLYFTVLFSLNTLTHSPVLAMLSDICSLVFRYLQSSHIYILLFTLLLYKHIRGDCDMTLYMSTILYPSSRSVSDRGQVISWFSLPATAIAVPTAPRVRTKFSQKSIRLFILNITIPGIIIYCM